MAKAIEGICLAKSSGISWDPVAEKVPDGTVFGESGIGRGGKKKKKKKKG